MGLNTVCTPTTTVISGVFFRVLTSRAVVGRKKKLQKISSTDGLQSIVAHGHIGLFPVHITSIFMNIVIYQSTAYSHSKASKSMCKKHIYSQISINGMTIMEGTNSVGSAIYETWVMSL